MVSSSVIGFILRPLRGPVGILGAGLFLLFVATALLAPWISPFDPMAINYLPAGQLARLMPPGEPYWLGTTYYGRDVLSQIICGARMSLLVGLTAAVITVSIGVNIGLVSGYFGGRTDALLMRLTDVAFGIPFLPFTVLLVALLQPSVWNIILTISCLQWRSAARVIRAQTMALRVRAFVRAAEVAGASHMRIMYRHIFPSLLPITLLYVAFGIAYSVLSEASISFLGFGDPGQVSWGGMLHDAYITGSLSLAWWPVLPAGACITLFVLSTFMIARQYERGVDPRLG
jgi:peptide/nickel transport system permease protein